MIRLSCLGLVSSLSYAMKQPRLCDSDSDDGVGALSFDIDEESITAGSSSKRQKEWYGHASSSLAEVVTVNENAAHELVAKLKSIGDTRSLVAMQTFVTTDHVITSCMIGVCTFEYVMPRCKQFLADALGVKAGTCAPYSPPSVFYVQYFILGYIS